MLCMFVTAADTLCEQATLGRHRSATERPVT